MSFPTRVDYIIVGQGLAGSALAMQLIKRGKKILVIDKADGNTSSRIAAGLFNPVTGKKMTRTWLANTLFPYLHQFYEDVERLTKSNFFFPLPLYRPFLSVQDQNEWMGKSSDPLYSPYIASIYTQKTWDGVNDNYGGLLLRQCGYLDTLTYIKAVQRFLETAGSFYEDLFLEDELTVTTQGVSYKGCDAKKIILCQGEQTLSGKWFGWVPIQPLKGETLTIKTAELPRNIINRGVYLVPADACTWRVGSTYNFHDKLRSITDSARLEIEQKLHELIDFPYEVIGQAWGMRPTTPDRRPILGAHPQFPDVVIFNGMGTKGVSLSPYFSEVLFHWLENETDLNKEVDVNRYKSLYSKFTK